MKKIIRTISLLLCFTVLASVVTYAASPSNPQKYDPLAENTTYHTIEVNGDIYYCSDVIEDREGEERVVCYNEDNCSILFTNETLNTLKITTYNKDTNGEFSKPTLYESEILCREDLADTEMYSVMSIGQKSETWWDMGYYYNTSSAYGDIYWRLYNPLDESEKSKYFFASYNTQTQSDAQEFAVSVNEMCGIEEGMDLAAGFQIPDILLSLGTAPSLTAIIAALAKASIKSITPSALFDLYNAKDKAIRYYEYIQ